jgi:DNA repair protein RadD
VTIVPYDYQVAAVASVHPLAPGSRKLLVLPTGAGKSVIAALLAVEGALIGRVLIITHVQELVEQNEADMRRLAPDADVGVYCASLGRKEIATITVCAVQSIYKKLDLFEDVELILVDEAHRISPSIGGKMYRAVLDHFKEVPIVGLTATPYRMGSGYLHQGDNKIFDEISYEVSYDYLVAEGYLAPFAERGSALAYDTSKLHIERGEFKSDELGELVDYPKTKAIVEQALERSTDRKFKLCFCINLRHCDIVRGILDAKGLTSVILHGGMSGDERREARELFELGLIDVAINCNIWAIGYNFRRLDCIWLIRPIASPGFFIQVAGRLTRTADGKFDGLLLDYGGNVSRHGHFGRPEVRPPSKGGGATKACKAPECGETNSQAARYCAVCKAQFTEMFKDCPKCDTQVDRMTQVCTKCGYGWPINEQKLDEEGSTILPNRALWLDVVDWNFRIHKKDGSPFKSLAIAYKTVDAGTIQEYIFPEHPHVQHRFVEWWSRHAITPITQKAPKTAPDAYNHRKTLKRPERIKVIRSGKFYQFLGRSF